MAREVSKIYVIDVAAPLGKTRVSQYAQISSLYNLKREAVADAELFLKKHPMNVYRVRRIGLDGDNLPISNKIVFETHETVPLIGTKERELSRRC